MTLFAARQPILDENKSVYAYELLFRDSLENVFPDVDADSATAKLIEGMQMNLGLNDLADNKRAFINFTHKTLVNGFPRLLPKEQVVVEILETVEPDKALLAACKKLYDKGYDIALDDYEDDPRWRHFFPYVSIIKVDFMLSTDAQILNIVEQAKAFPHITLLAEKVETYEEFKQAKEWGFTLFQGYFFSRPEVIKHVSLGASQVALAQLMAEMSQADPNVQQLTRTIQDDVNLSFKLLRYAQSPMFKRARAIENIRQAVVALGNSELRRFISLLFTSQFTNEKPLELSIMAQTRAFFCELACDQVGLAAEAPSAFLVGMLSLLDAMLDSDLPKLIEELPVSERIKAALLKKEGKLASLLQLCEGIEKGDWHQVHEWAAKLGISTDAAGKCYIQAITQVSQRVGAVNS